MDRQCLVDRINDPVVGHFVGVVGALLDDEVAAAVRREDLADPVGTEADRRLAGQDGQALAAPTRHVRPDDLGGRQGDLGPGREPPAARSTAAPVVRPNPAKDAALGAAMWSRCCLLLDEHAIEDLVVAALLGDGEQVGNGGRARSSRSFTASG
jgi:hypothetical protein